MIFNNFSIKLIILVLFTFIECSASFLNRIASFSETKPVSEFVCDFTQYGILNETIGIPNYEGVFDFITNIKGISLLNVGPLLSFDRETRFIYFQKNRFDLYDQNGTIIEADRCDADFFQDKQVHFFSNMDSATLTILMNANYFEKPICPFIFKNAVIDQLTLHSFGDKLLYHNFMSFYPVKNAKSPELDLKAKIRVLDFSNLFRNNFKQGSIDTYVFSSVEVLCFQGLLGSIEQEFFADFKRMNRLEMYIINVGEFFHASNNEWFSSIFINGVDFKSKENFLNSIYHPTDNSLSIFRLIVQQMRFDYDYPEEDFCLFQHYPVFKTIISNFLNGRIKNGASRSPSCTYRYLARNNKVLNELIYANLGVSVDAPVFDDSFLEECDFERLLNLCRNSSSPARYSPVTLSFEYSDVLYALNWLEFIGPVLTFPIFAAIAFVLNLLVILIIQSKRNKRERFFESKTFKFLEMNSAFNCVECLVYQFRLMGLCLGVNSVFCSSIRDHEIAFYIGVFNIYLIEAMKSCSMITGLMFSVQRYIETSKTKNKLLRAFSETQTRRVLVWVLLYGFCVSVFVIFSIDFTYSRGAYDTPNTFYLTLESYKRNTLKTYLYFAHFIVNDLVCLLVNLAFDIFLVEVVKKDLQQKILGKKNMLSQNLHALTASEKKKLKEEESKKTSVERKANEMIILSVIIYFFCRLPELIGSFVFFYFSQIYYHSCESGLLCYILANMVEYMYMISYIFNIFIYYKFNVAFHKGLKNYFRLNIHL